MSVSRRDAGFTLVELLVAIGIVGVLSAVAVPVFVNQQENALWAKARADASGLSSLVGASYAISGEPGVVSRTPAGYSYSGAAGSMFFPDAARVEISSAHFVTEEGFIGAEPVTAENFCAVVQYTYGFGWAPDAVASAAYGPGSENWGPFSEKGGAPVTVCKNTVVREDAEEPATAPPSAPTDVTVTPSGASAISVSFTAPADNFGAPTDYYLVETAAALDGPRTEFGVGPDTSWTFTGFTPGQEVFVFVTAVNALGSSAPAVGSVVLPLNPSPDPDPSPEPAVDAPSVPRNVSVSAGEVPGELLVSWDAPAENFGAFTDGYWVYTADSVNGQWVEMAFTPDTSVTLGGFAPGQEVFVFVLAENAAGLSPVAVASATPSGVVVVTAVDGSAGFVEVSFATGSSGAAVQSLQYSLDGGADGSWVTASSTSSPVVVPVPDDNTTYTIQLRLVSGGGAVLGTSQQVAWCNCWLG